MKTLLFFSLICLTILAQAQQGNQGFFKNLEMSFSHSFEYDEVMLGRSNNYAEIALKGLPNGKQDLGLAEHQQMDEDPLEEYRFDYDYCGGVIGLIGMFAMLEPSFNSYSLELSKPIISTDDRLSYSLELGYRSAINQFQLHSESLYFVADNYQDSFLYQDKNGMLEDTLVILPSVSYASFSMPVNMFSIGIGTKLCLLGNAQSKWRLFFSASFRRMFSSNLTLKSHVGQYSIDYHNYYRMPRAWWETNYTVTKINSTYGPRTQLEFPENKLSSNSYLFGFNVERQLWSECVNWGLRLQIGINSYKLNRQVIDTDLAGRLGGYLAFRL